MDTRYFIVFTNFDLIKPLTLAELNKIKKTPKYKILYSGPIQETPAKKI